MKNLCAECGAVKGKGRWCPTCAVYRGEQSETPTVQSRRGYRFGANATVALPSASVSPGDANISEPENLSVRLTLKPGVQKVPCSCGCGKLVIIGPVYFSSACRSRAWRRKKTE